MEIVVLVVKWYTVCEATHGGTKNARPTVGGTQYARGVGVPPSYSRGKRAVQII